MNKLKLFLFTSFAIALLSFIVLSASGDEQGFVDCGTMPNSYTAFYYTHEEYPRLSILTAVYTDEGVLQDATVDYILLGNMWVRDGIETNPTPTASCEGSLINLDDFTIAILVGDTPPGGLIPPDGYQEFVESLASPTSKSFLPTIAKTEAYP